MLNSLATMKISFRYGSVAPIHRTISQSVRSSLKSNPPLKPQTPLFLRPPVHVATPVDLQKWHDWAKAHANSVGTAFTDSDDGPDSTLLLRELRWLMEDAIEGRTLASVRLRASLEDLERLWRERIEERRPFQYVVGCEHWRDLVLCVEEGVLVPRPETERIVELASEAVEADVALGSGLWADLGTGSGAIAIGIGRVLKSKGGKVIATDLSHVALAVAGFNVQRYDLQGVIELRQGSWFEPLDGMNGEFSGIVSNPPYIPSDHISGLQAEVGRHEPRMALDGGVDGMDDLLHLCKGASSMLKSGGFFAFETNGEKQCKHLLEYMETVAGDSFCKVKVVPDFAGINRFVTGFRK